MSLFAQLQLYVDRFPRAKAAVRPTWHVAVAAYCGIRIFVHRQQARPIFIKFRHKIGTVAENIPSIDIAGRKNKAKRIGRNARGRDVVMLVVSDLRIDPRVEREARALATASYNVTVICPDPTQGVSLPVIDWGDKIKIQFLHWTASTFVSYFPGYLANDLYLEAARRRPFAYHAHDLNTGYAGLAAAKYTGAHLIADFHEWTSENVHYNAEEKALMPYKGEWKADLQRLETRLLNEASAVVTVCDSIADAMAVELGGKSRATVIHNIPKLDLSPTRDYPPLKQQLNIPEDRFVLLWQGGTGPTRLIEPIIEALEFAPKCTFVIRGPSLDLFGDDYRALAAKAGASERLILQGPVPSRDVVAAARGADAGIWTLPKLCRNFTYALPNKIFEYIASGLPILVADYPEARRMVETHKVGLIFDPYDPKSIAATINRLIDDPAFAKTCRDNTVTALATLDATSEWQKLVTLYDNLPRSADVKTLA